MPARAFTPEPRRWPPYNGVSTMPATVDAFIKDNQSRFLDELKEFIRIPSISTLPEHVPDIGRAAAFVSDGLRAAGMENIEVIPTAKHPLVYADWLHAPGKPTVLCYGHYDVQPADPLELWVTPPFEPTERDGNLYARGSCDDKGQMYMHIKGRRGAAGGQWEPSGERQVSHRGRRGGGRRVHRQVRGGEPRQTARRCGPGFRHRHVRRRHADAVHRPARPDLYGSGSHPARCATCIRAFTAARRPTRFTG